MHKKAEQSSSRTNSSQKTTEPDAAQKQESAIPTRVKERRCFLCQGTGHYKRDCPNRQEAPGRSKSTSSSTAGTIAADLTEDELERLLTQKRLAKEGALMPSSNNTVSSASEGKAGVIGSLLEGEVEIEGVPVKALLDTGAQSTIISRPTLHAMAKHLKENNLPKPELEMTTARLYGKDGKNGGRALYITAQVQFTVSLRSRSVTVPVFVQPDSEQVCLLGMNVLPLLGIEVRHSDGTQLLPVKQKTNDLHKSAVSTISLLTSTVIPSHKGCVLQAQSSCPDVILSDGHLQVRSISKHLLFYRLPNNTSQVYFFQTPYV